MLFVHGAEEVRKSVPDRCRHPLLGLTMEKETPVGDLVLRLKAKQDCVARRRFQRQPGRPSSGIWMFSEMPSSKESCAFNPSPVVFL